MMTTFHLIRHGQANWVECDARGLKGFSRDFTALTENGINQIENTAQDDRLFKASLVLSSPYTRALMSAAVISKVVQLPLTVEFDLREWMPDSRGNYASMLEIFALADDFEKNHGIHPNNETRVWETLTQLKTRMSTVLERYKHLDHVIVVCHEMVIWSVTGTRDVANGQIIELEL